MKNHNRIQMGLPFKEEDYIVFSGQKTKWRIVAIFETGNYLVAENNDKPKQMYLDKLIEKIDRGLARVVS